MQIRVDFPAAEVGEFARQVFDKQMPFATSLALNRVANRFQEEEREHLDDIFNLRQDRWAKRSIKIAPGDRATKTNPTVRIAVDAPPGGPSGSDDILGKFEDERSKSPRDGRFIAVPTEHVPRTASGVIKKAWRPKSLRERNFRNGFRTFVSSTSRGKAIYFDESAAGGGIVPLYWLVPSVPIEPDLQFVETANMVVDRSWVEEFGRAFDIATRTAR